MSIKHIVLALAAAVMATPAGAIIVANANLGQTNSDGAGGSISFVVTDPDPVPVGYDGPLTASISHDFDFSADSGVLEAFTDTFQFSTLRNGEAAATFSNTAVTLLQSLTFSGVVGDVTFSNGVDSFAVSILASGRIGDISNVPIIALNTNILTISGLARGDAFYNGSVTFAPNAVPELGTWSMMLMGFGAAGSAVRRRKAAERKLALA